VQSISILDDTSDIAVLDQLMQLKHSTLTLREKLVFIAYIAVQTALTFCALQKNRDLKENTPEIKSDNIRRIPISLWMDWH
jgi:hypothetical protein